MEVHETTAPVSSLASLIIDNLYHFNIHGTKYFQYAVFLQKSNIYDVLSLLNLWWAKKTCSPREILTQLFITEKI